MKTKLKCGLQAFAMLAAAVLSTGAAAQELKVSHFLPPNHTFHKEFLRWGEELKKKSGGKLTLTVFPAAQMGPPPRQFDLARTGVADMALSLHGQTPGRFPLTEIAQLPFAVDSAEAASRKLTELVPQYLAKEHAGVKVLYLLATPPLMVHLAKHRVTTLEDFKGLRIRYSGQQSGETVRALGAVPVAVPPAESADAMAKGTVDGAMFPYEGAASFQLGNVTKYTLEPGLHSATFFLVMNPASYDKLAPELRKLIDDTTGPAAAARIGRDLDQAEVDGKKYMISNKVEVVRLAPAALAKVREATDVYTRSALSQLEAKGLPAQAVYKELRSVIRD